MNWKIYRRLIKQRLLKTMNTKNIEWVSIKDQNGEQFNRTDNSNSFTIMSYNLLAQALVSRDLFPSSSKSALKWKTRSTLLVQTIQKFNPEIACLQEMDQYEEFWKERLRAMGYKVEFSKNIKKSHGLCIAAKEENWTIQETETLEYDNIKEYPTTIKTGNILQLVKLKNKAGQNLLVANTHLFWRPDFDYERMRQMLFAIRTIKKYKEIWNAEVVFAGDFNSQPYKIVYKSITHHLFDKVVFDRMVEELKTSFLIAKQEKETAEQLVKTANEDLNKIKLLIEQGETTLSETSSNGDCKKSKISLSEIQLKLDKSIKVHEENILHYTERIQNEMKLIPPKQLYDEILLEPKLMSCYSNYASLDPSYQHSEWHDIKEPKFTNYTDVFKSTLDFIFLMESSKLINLELLKLPNPESLGKGLPDDKYPSDHLPIMVRLGWLE